MLTDISDIMQQTQQHIHLKLKHLPDPLSLAANFNPRWEFSIQGVAIPSEGLGRLLCAVQDIKTSVILVTCPTKRRGNKL